MMAIPNQGPIAQAILGTMMMNDDGDEGWCKTIVPTQALIVQAILEW
jgi:hypothetical protein